MTLFVQLMEYADNSNIYGYSVFGTALALLSLGVSLLLVKGWSVHGPTNLPIVGVESPGYFARVKARQKFVLNAFQIVRDAYYEHYGKNFVVTTNSYDKVILTHAQVRELSNVPDDVLSFAHANTQLLMGQYTGMNRFVDTQYIQDAMKIKLTRNLGNILGAQLEETQFAMDAELPGSAPNEWVSVDLFPTAIRIVARVSARSFIGLPVCRNEDWLKLAITFTEDLISTASKLGAISKLFRLFYAYMSNAVKTIKSHKKKAETLLAPTIQKRFEEQRLAEENGAVYQGPKDLLQWLIDRVEPHHKTVDALSELQLLIGLASIFATAGTLVGMIFDLAEHRDCIEPMREEMEAGISENGGVLDRGVLQKMRKTDSFLRESMRMGTLLLSFNRMAMKNVTLSDGTYLPKGTLIAAPALMFASYPDFVEDPATFDGFRWYKKTLEAKDGAPKGNGSATTSSNNLAFGHGKHACPGRFFAVEEIKTILTFILLQYDIKYPEGQSRPPNLRIGEFAFPNRTQKIMFKKLPGLKRFSFL
ncbi:cytochrome P450 [Tuber indicum]|nr:cytochrome P450 [Tuber indicum]